MADRIVDDKPCMMFEGGYGEGEQCVFCGWTYPAHVIRNVLGKD